MCFSLVYTPGAGFEPARAISPPVLKTGALDQTSLSRQKSVIKNLQYILVIQILKTITVDESVKNGFR